ncbi:hypothetical protein [Streptomyces sp. NPDC048496]
MTECAPGGPPADRRDPAGARGDLPPLVHERHRINQQQRVEPESSARLLG